MLSSTLNEVAALLRSGKTSATEVCAKCLARIQAIKDLNSFVTVTPKLAQNQALETNERFSKGKCSSPLAGIPVAIKDNYSTREVMTSCGSRMLHDYIPPYNATVVHRLLDNGGVMLGKTNLDEFAMGSGSIDSFYGPVRNPWKYNFSNNLSAYTTASDNTVNNQKQKTFKTTSGGVSQPVSGADSTVHHQEIDGSTDWFVPGGSSGGSAAAVAAGACFVGMGSDTGGSVRIPASFCGVVGLKPTYGLVSRHGLISLVNSMDVPGIFTRSIDDTVSVLNVLAGYDEHDSTTVTDQYVPFTIPDEISMNNVHIGIPKDFNYPGLSPEVLDTWNKLADNLSNAGAKVTQVSLPHNKYSLAVYCVLNCCEVASNMARYDGIEFGHRAEMEDSTEKLYSATRHEGFNDVVRGRILCGNYFLLEGNYEEYFVKAQKVRRLLQEDFNKVYNSGVDVILTPTALDTAPSYKHFVTVGNRTEQQIQDIYTMAANLVGIPAINIPVKLSQDGLPIGLQLMGQCFQEKELLTVSKWIEQQMNFTYLNLDFLDS